MKISGYFSEFSLGEVFRFLEQGQKTGCLSLKSMDDSASVPFLPAAPEHYLFFRYGQIVAATTTLNHQGLRQLIEQRGYLHPLTMQRVMSRYQGNMPLGVFLKAQSVLDSPKIQLLFKQQVLTPIPYIFAWKEGYFQFDAHHPLPFAEMTGLSTSPQAVTLAGLRLVRDWTPLLDKLPLADSTIVSLVSEPPSVQLGKIEWQVWEHIDGTTTIQQIAQKLNLPVLEVQKICFRLMVMGMVEEVVNVSLHPSTAPSVSPTDPSPVSEMDADPVNTSSTALSSSFLNEIIGFLKTKVSR